MGGVEAMLYLAVELSVTVGLALDGTSKCEATTEASRVYCAVIALTLKLLSSSSCYTRKTT